MNKKVANTNTTANKRTDRTDRAFTINFLLYVLAFVSLLALILLISSIASLHSAWEIIGEQVIEAWLMVRIPLIASIVCLAWFGMMALIAHMIKR